MRWPSGLSFPAPPGHLTSDGIHPSPVGALAYAQLIAATIPPAGPTGADGYVLPLDLTWYQAHPDWFTKPHHDYPAADIPVPTGTTVYAAAAGVVISAPTDGPCGKGVVIDGDDGHRYTYCHGTAPLVPQGARVTAGDPIMASGTTGASSGPHLHFQIQLGRGTGPVVCPQDALVAWATGQTIDIAQLPTNGCTY